MPKLVVVCPGWAADQDRSSGGSRYKAVRYSCARCAAPIALKVGISRELGPDKSGVKLICDQCSLFLDSNPDLLEAQEL